MVNIKKYIGRAKTNIVKLQQAQKARDEKYHSPLEIRKRQTRRNEELKILQHRRKLEKFTNSTTSKRSNKKDTSRLAWI